SIGLAFDTGIKDILVTGDFNLDQFKNPTKQKINDIFLKYGLSQVIHEAIENSQSLVDLILVSSPELIPISGVGEPFLDQSILKRTIWKYSDGNYELLRNEISLFDWNTCFDQDIDVQATMFTKQLLFFCELCIPNKTVTIRTSHPPWFHNEIRTSIRRRKRAYKRAKKTKNPAHLATYKQLRNEANHLIRSAKHSHFNKLAYALREQHHNSDFWKLIKQFTQPTSAKQNIPSLIHNNQIYEDNYDKANILNMFFQSQ
ncbi:hypothetical protein MAR_009213, partial [Mya arenaria]